ncbi:MAG: GIY-YIG nuclease family protein [Bacteroidota bacterium]
MNSLQLQSQTALTPPFDFWVYVLRSLKDGKLYIGQTNNLQDRLLRHNQGRVKSTKSRRPFVLAHVEKVPTRSEARQREDFLKSPRGWLFLKAHVRQAQPVTT